jgi:hypothetical protein
MSKISLNQTMSKTAQTKLSKTVQTKPWVWCVQFYSWFGLYRFTHGLVCTDLLMVWFVLFYSWFGLDKFYSWFDLYSFTHGLV